MVWNMPSRVMPALLTSTVDRAEIRFDPAYAGRRGLHVADIPLVDGDAGLGLEPLGRLVIARIDGSDRMAGVLQAFLRSPRRSRVSHL